EWVAVLSLTAGVALRPIPPGATAPDRPRPAPRQADRGNGVDPVPAPTEIDVTLSDQDPAAPEAAVRGLGDGDDGRGWGSPLCLGFHAPPNRPIYAEGAPRRLEIRPPGWRTPVDD